MTSWLLLPAGDGEDGHLQLSHHHPHNPVGRSACLHSIFWKQKTAWANDVKITLVPTNLLWSHKKYNQPFSLFTGPLLLQKYSTEAETGVHTRVIKMEARTLARCSIYEREQVVSPKDVFWKTLSQNSSKSGSHDWGDKAFFQWQQQIGKAVVLPTALLCVPGGTVQQIQWYYHLVKE